MSDYMPERDKRVRNVGSYITINDVKQDLHQALYSLEHEIISNRVQSLDPNGYSALQSILLNNDDRYFSPLVVGIQKITVRIPVHIFNPGKYVTEITKIGSSEAFGEPCQEVAKTAFGRIYIDSISFATNPQAEQNLPLRISAYDHRNAELDVTLAVKEGPSTSEFIIKPGESIAKHLVTRYKAVIGFMDALGDGIEISGAIYAQYVGIKTLGLGKGIDKIEHFPLKAKIKTTFKTSQFNRDKLESAIVEADELKKALDADIYSGIEEYSKTRRLKFLEQKRLFNSTLTVSELEFIDKFKELLTKEDNLAWEFNDISNRNFFSIYEQFNTVAPLAMIAKDKSGNFVVYINISDDGAKDVDIVTNSISDDEGVQFYLTVEHHPDLTRPDKLVDAIMRALIERNANDN